MSVRISRCDDCFAVANDDVLAGERLQLSGEIAGAAVLNDPGFVVSAPELADLASGSDSRW